MIFLLIFIYYFSLIKSDSDRLYVGDLHNKSVETVSEESDCKFRNRVGECREIRNCPPFLHLLVGSRSRPSYRALKLLRQSHCGFRGKEPRVCCPKTHLMRFDSGPGHFEETKSDAYSSCGAIGLDDKIIGGNEAGMYNFPWMALVGYETPQGLEYRCGGTLINRRYILTAAHCVKNFKSITPKSVRLGEYDLSAEVDCYAEDCAQPAMDFTIKRCISHPNFNDKDLKNDVALIELNDDVNFTKSVRPICLPIEKAQRRRHLNGETGIISGWGATEHGTYNSVLLSATIGIMSQEECFRKYEGIIPIFPTQMCAGGEGRKDSCRGDSGGPLLVVGKNDKNEPVYIQYGIVSFGPRLCGTRGKPGVYTRVALFMDWIMDVMK